MASDISKQRAKLATLNAALGELEKELEPLFAQSLQETLLGLDTMQQAKLQVALPYLVYDLVFSALSMLRTIFMFSHRGGPLSLPQNAWVGPEVAPSY